MLKLTLMSASSNLTIKEIFLMIILHDIICKMMSFYILNIINIIDIDVLTYFKVLIIFYKYIDNNIHDRVSLHIKCY